MATLLTQDLGRKWILPLALERMRKDILDEGDCGSTLLASIVRSDDYILESYLPIMRELHQLIEVNRSNLEDTLGFEFYRRAIVKLGKMR